MNISLNSSRRRSLGLLTILSFLLIGPLSSLSQAQSYSNSGNNITGFVIKFGPGVTTNGSELVVTSGTWDTTPGIVSGNFKITYQVLNSSNDGDMHFMLLNPGTTGGIDVRNSPQGTDSPSINIFGGTDFTQYNQFYIYNTGLALATAPTQQFPNQQWTSGTISRTGNILTNNIGGQSIQADVSSYLGSSVQLGIGGYATTNLGGSGFLYYRNVAAVPKPTAQGALASIFLILLTGLVWRNRRAAASLS